MIEERVRQGLFEPAWGPYRNAHFLVPKKNAKYRFLISAVSANRYTLENTGIPPNIEECSAAFTGLPISSLIDFHYGYDQKMLHEDSRDHLAFQTKQAMCRPTTSAKNISVRTEWLRQSGRAQSELSETPRWRIIPRPASRPRVESHIALRSPFRSFFSLRRSPILNQYPGVVANCDHTLDWVHWAHACIGISMP